MRNRFLFNVYVLIYGTGDDGNERQIDSVYSTWRKAFNAWKRETGKNTYPTEWTEVSNLQWSVEPWGVA